MLEKIEAIHAKIVQGQLTSARKDLRALTQNKIPEPLRYRVANLARRVDLPLLAIRLLNPIVRPTEGRSSSLSNRATPLDIAEYSASLTFIGAFSEALELLKKVPFEKHPEGLLYTCFAYVASWNYAPTIPLLKRYIASSKIDDYARSIGKVNLLAAYVNEHRYEEAESLKEELVEECSRLNFFRLLGNTFELTAHHYVNQLKAEEAKKTIAAAEKLFAQNATLDSFYVKKWEVHLALAQKPKLEKNISALHLIRAEAQKRRLWETVRESDKCEAIYTKNEKLLWDVYFGTPYTPFKDRMLLEYGINSPPSDYVMELKKGKEATTLDLQSGNWLDPKKITPLIKPGQVCHRLLQVLFSDWYRPIRVAVAHHELFPEEHFNPISSAHRVHESVRRLRTVLKKKKIPLLISEKEGYYQVAALQPMKIQLTVVKPCQGAALADFLIIKKNWGNTIFSLQEFAALLKRPKRSAIRSLNQLLEQKLLVRTGQSSSTRYQLCS